jgi:hypothetical protein
MAHYVLTTRDDTAYWKHIRYNNDRTDSLINILSNARAGNYTAIENQSYKLYYTVNWNMILSGMGFFGQQPEPQKAIDLSRFRIHADFLKENVFDGDYEEAFQDIPFRSSTHPTWYPTW